MTILSIKVSDITLSLQINSYSHLTLASNHVLSIVEVILNFLTKINFKFNSKRYFRIQNFKLLKLCNRRYFRNRRCFTIHCNNGRDCSNSKRFFSLYFKIYLRYYFYYIHASSFHSQS